MSDITRSQISLKVRCHKNQTFIKSQTVTKSQTVIYVSYHQKSDCYQYSDHYQKSNRVCTGNYLKKSNFKFSATVTSLQLLMHSKGHSGHCALHSGTPMLQSPLKKKQKKDRQKCKIARQNTPVQGFALFAKPGDNVLREGLKKNKANYPHFVDNRLTPPPPYPHQPKLIIFTLRNFIIHMGKLGKT